MQRPQTAQRQETVERGARYADDVRPVGALLRKLPGCRHHGAADDVAVAVDVLGGRMDNEVGTEGDRVLQSRRQERVIHGEQSTARRCYLAYRGQIRDPQHRI